MLRPRLFGTLLALAVISLGVVAAGTDDPSIVVFYEDGCSACEAMDLYLESLLVEQPQILVSHYELTQPGNMDLLLGLLDAYGAEIGAVPILFIGGQAFVAAGEADSENIVEAIARCATGDCPSPLATPTDRTGDLLMLAAFAALFAVLYLLQGP